MQILNKYFDLYKNSELGEWFEDIDTSKLTFYWCKGMNNENQVLGAWNPLFYNSIYLKWFDRSKLTGNEILDETKYDSHFSLVIPTVLHEIYHRHQCDTYTLIPYSILALPFWREYTIETSAYKISDDAFDWMQKLDQEKFNIRFNELHKTYYGDDFDLTTRKFKENYDKEFCTSQYEQYLLDRKNNKIYPVPSLIKPY